MLGCIFAVALPMVLLLAVTVFVVSQTESRPQSQPNTSSSTRTRTSAQDSGIRRRNHPRGQMPASSRHDTLLASFLSYPQFVDEDRCAICFENVPCVRLYPCQHGDICVECANRIVTNERFCPFCRTQIHGYE